MDLTPILSAAPAVQIHLMAAVMALLLGPFAIYRQRRDRLHKGLGYTWVLVMTVTAGSGLFIETALWPRLGPFGPIHLLSLWALYTLWRGVQAARRRDLATHQMEMRSLYWQALGIAGLFTLLPGRLLNRALFPDLPELGFVAILLGGGVILVQTVRARRRGKAA